MTTMFFALMSAVSATTLITLVADADATKHKRRPRREQTVWIILKYFCVVASATARTTA